ncbi:unannotated protein [freshwater metagenome]|uniref:Unannotated protein n=1 Tax=freshwater metagenome TaxID=449393 RepID=A0A6J7CSQ9_9ZZZZ|nr:sigma-70 family RNA polymerase sigma factor [Actinomycetota bacterium]
MESTYQAERDLIAEYARLDADDPARSKVREALIVIHQPLVRHLAQRYANRGEPLDDLIQAGSIGLINAVDRFDPAQSDSFTSFAMATILGEIRKHFRETAWSIKVPRRLQELSREVNQVRGSLEQSLRRSPTVAEIAQALDRTTEDVLDALEAAQAYRLSSLDIPEQPLEVSEQDRSIAAVLNRGELGPALASLTQRDRELLTLRFVEEKSQAQIAELLSMEQSQVSRQIARILSRMRDQLLDNH